MTRDVSVRIIGLQQGDGEEPVITNAPGIYQFTNDKHYIRYDEKLEDSEAVSKNLLKISPSEIVLTKKGAQQLQMVFDLSEASQVIYHTPYGSLTLDINTKSIQIMEEMDKMQIILKYELNSDGNPISDHELIILIENMISEE